MKNKSILKVFCFITILVVSVAGIYLLKEHNDTLKAELKAEMIKINNENKLKDINYHYNDVVKVSINSNLYKLENNKYTKVGTIYKGEVISLEETKINLNTKYFKIKGMDYYIEYNRVEKTDKLNTVNNRYKNYLLFNENVVSNDNVTLYRDGKAVYTFNFSLDLPIIIKDENGYFVEYLNELLFINKKDVAQVKNNHNTDAKEARSVPVTVYHFIYLEGDRTCTGVICHSEKQIRSHFDYLKSKNYFTMNTTELRLYLEGNLRAPEKSILITIDDGGRAENFIPILEEYKINATLFLITGWFGKDIFKSPYLELGSHTDSLHNTGVCSGGQGSPLKCLPHDQLVADLKLSRSKVDNSEAFCFPFYEYNNHAVEAVRDAGFKIGFIGSSVKATRGKNLLLTPRITILNDTTLEEYISVVN